MTDRKDKEDIRTILHSKIEVSSWERIEFFEAFNGSLAKIGNSLTKFAEVGYNILPHLYYHIIHV